MSYIGADAFFKTAILKSICQKCKMYLFEMFNVFPPSPLSWQMNRFTCRLCCPLPSPLCHTKGQQNTTSVFASATSSLLPMSFSALVAQLYNASLEEHIGKGFLQLFSSTSSIKLTELYNCVNLVRQWVTLWNYDYLSNLCQEYLCTMVLSVKILHCSALQWWWRLQRFHDHHIIIFSVWE